jgi:hypothetical protein
MKLSGKCLCGAVSFEGEGDGHFHACHCAMCRAWGGGPAMAVAVRDLELEGEDAVAIYRSSDWAERLFCSNCGSHLFWRMADGSMTMTYAAGLDQAGELKLAGEIYVDQQPACYAFSGDHPRMTEAEFLASIGVAPQD